MGWAKHNHDYLVEKLKASTYTDPDEAFGEYRKPLKSFLRVSFISQSKWDTYNDKRKERMEGRVVVLDDEYVKSFTKLNENGQRVTTGIPGMPAKIRREEFDPAWTEAKGE